MTRQRSYRITLVVDYVASGQESTTDLADEIKRCERSFKEVIKQRGAKNITVLVTGAEVED
jgi:hypothetical protein